MRSHHYAGNKRYCCVCGAHRLVKEMRRSTVRAQRWLCPDCLEPALSACLCCARQATCKGLCHTHFERWRRWGKPDPLEEWARAFREERLNTCSVCGKRWNGYHGCRHCSPECLAQHKRQASLEYWHHRSPESKANAIRRSGELATQKRRASWIEQVCPYCQATFWGATWRKTCGKRRCKSQHTTTHTKQFRTRTALSGLPEIAAQMEDRHEEKT